MSGRRRYITALMAQVVLNARIMVEYKLLEKPKYHWSVLSPINIPISLRNGIMMLTMIYLHMISHREVPKKYGGNARSIIILGKEKSQSASKDKIARFVQEEKYCRASMI